jgi:acyl-CoA hydrolase
MTHSKTVSSTAVENHTHKIFPNELNTNGTLFGGVLVGILDRLSLVVAERHSETTCVTVSIDAFHFLAAARLGEVLICKASLNRAWNTSMEVGVKVVAENYHTGAHKHIVSAYFTFVALSGDNTPVSVPQLIPETALEKRRFVEANIRRENRISASADKKTRRTTSP